MAGQGRLLLLLAWIVHAVPCSGSVVRIRILVIGGVWIVVVGVGAMLRVVVVTVLRSARGLRAPLVVPHAWVRLRSLTLLPSCGVLLLLLLMPVPAAVACAITIAIGPLPGVWILRRRRSSCSTLPDIGGCGIDLIRNGCQAVLVFHLGRRLVHLLLGAESIGSIDAAGRTAVARRSANARPRASRPTGSCATCSWRSSSVVDWSHPRG